MQNWIVFLIVMITQFAECSRHSSFQNEPFENEPFEIDAQVIRQGDIEEGNHKKIVLLSSVQEIKKKAFYGWENIEEFDMGDSHVKTIEEEAFSNCRNLRKFVGNHILAQIRAKAFESCENLEIIQRIGGVQYIECFAFSGCTSLKEITFGSNLFDFDQRAFKGCTSLENFFSSERNFFDENGIIYKNSRNNLYCFPPGRKEGYFFDQYIESVLGGAFFECNYLTEICLPGVKYILDNAFVRCINLKTVHLGKDLRSILGHAFEGIQNFQVFYDGKKNPRIHVFAFDESVQIFTFTSYPHKTFGGNDVVKVKKIKGLTKITPGVTKKFCPCGLKGRYKIRSSITMITSRREGNRYQRLTEP